jgi:hypothetical protein
LEKKMVVAGHRDGNSISGHHLLRWFCFDSNAATDVLFQSEMRWKDRDTMEEWSRGEHKAKA